MSQIKYNLMRLQLFVAIIHFAVASKARRYVRYLSDESPSPSASWTEFPTRTPNIISQSPSATLISEPSSSPTPVCHDLTYYKSPINDLPCWAFRNTDCLAWKYIGLTDLQVMELLQSCPESCKVECGFSTSPSLSPSVSYRTLVVDVEFYAYGAADLLNSDEKAFIEKLVENFISSTLTNGSSTIQSFTINDQRIVSDHVKSLRTRRLGDLTLLIQGEVVIRTIDETLTSNRFKALFSQIMDSPMLQEELKNDAIIAGLVVSSSNSIGGTPYSDPSTTNDKKSRKKALTICSIILGTGSVMFLIVFMYRKQMRLKYSDQLSPDNKLRHEYHDPEENQWEDATQPHRNRYPAFVFEDEPKQFDTINIVQMCNEEDAKKNFHISPKSPNGMKPKPEFSVMTNIPSMIIFDNIDDEKCVSPSEDSRSSANGQNTPTCQQSMEVTSVRMRMPVKRVEASSELMAVLSSKKVKNPNQAYNLLTAIRSTDEDESRTNRSSDGISPKTFASSQLSIGEGTSILSTPCCMNMGEHSVASQNKRNMFTFEGNDGFAEEDFAVIFDKMTQSDKKKNIRLRNLSLFKKRDDVEDEDDQVSFSLHSHFESEDDLSDESTHAEEQGRSEIDIAPSKHEDHIVRNHSRSNDFYEQNQSMDTRDDMNRYMHVVSYSLPSPEKCVKDRLSPNQFHYTFQAPSTGKLGIVIVGKPSPTVYDIKGYSPLFGKVDVGDVITSIDDECTTHMSVSDITKFIDLRRSIANKLTQKIKITVMSNIQKTNLKDDIQSKADEDKEDYTSFPKYEELDTNIQLSYSADSDNISCHLLGHLGEDDSSEDEDSGFLKNL